MRWYFLILVIFVLTGCSRTSYIPLPSNSVYVNNTNYVFNGTTNNITNNFTTYINTTNNITNDIINNVTNNVTNNITNNFTTINNISAGVFEANLTKSGSTIQLTKQYADGSVRIDNVSDTSGSGGGVSYPTPWANAVNNGGFLKEYDFESVTVGYTGLHIPLAMTVGTTALTNCSTLGGLNGFNTDSSCVTISTNGTSGSGYSFNVGTSGTVQTFQLREGMGSITYFRPLTISQCSVSPCMNWSTGRMGFMNIYTTANVVNGMFCNFTMYNSTHGILNGVIANNSARNVTLTNVIISNNTDYYCLTYASNGTSYFTLYQNISRGNLTTGSAVWNGSINMYPWNLGRKTGHSVIMYKIGNTTPAQIIGQAGYTNIFGNRSL
jgi:hypothetical protein